MHCTGDYYNEELKTKSELIAKQWRSLNQIVGGASLRIKPKCTPVVERLVLILINIGQIK